LQERDAQQAIRSSDDRRGRVLDVGEGTIANAARPIVIAAHPQRELVRREVKDPSQNRQSRSPCLWEMSVHQVELRGDPQPLQCRALLRRRDRELIQIA
jgi:hypothetical protein